jgi:hypothetical protein
MMARPPYCEWPRSRCDEPPRQHDYNGAAFCPVHYEAWALVMWTLGAEAARHGAEIEEVAFTTAKDPSS